MWNLATLQASRVGLRRIFMQAAAILVVALFANTLLAPSAMAADATWNGTTLTYNGQTFQPDSTLPNRPNEPHEYVYRDSSVTPPTATMLYFGGNDPTQATSATLVTCTYTNTPGSPGSWSYVNCSQPQTVNAIPVTAAPPKQAVASSCDASVAQGVGWLVCSLSNYIAGGVDNIYTIIRDFLEVQPVLETNTKTNKPSGIYQLWDVIRTIANVCFVIAFLVIIYSQITGAGISNYGLKDMIPRLIVAALLVNVSFWIAALAVDASNIIGHNIYAIVENIKSSMTVVGGDVSWPVITNFILSAGTVGTLGFAVAAGGSVASLGFILLAALISAAVSVLVAFIILAARQALITVMIAIAPLAFVAYLLPNTRSLFSKWGKSFMTLLLFFPIFALLFGGSQLAGAAIIDNAGGRLHIVLVGLATQFVPLVITPLIIRFSSGLLGQIANMTNNSSRGLIDRARGWATDNADMWAARKRAKTAGDIERRQNGEKVNPFRARGIGRLAYGLDQSKRRREAYKKTSEDMLQATHERQWNRRMNEPSEGLGTAQRNFARIHHQTHQIHKQAGEEKAKDDAHAEQQWVSYLGSTAGSRYRDMRRETLLTTNSTKALDEAMTAADQRTFDTLVAQASPTNDNGYLQIRRAKEQSVADTQHAQFQASEVQAAGEREFRRAFEDGVPGSRDLRQQNVRIERMKKESTTIANTLQKRADADWERISLTQQSVQSLRLAEADATDSHRHAEAQWNEVLENTRTLGSEAPGLLPGNKKVANSLQAADTLIRATESAVEEAKQERSKLYVKQLKSDESLRKLAAGIGGKDAQTRILAQAKSQVVEIATKAVQTNRTLASELTRRQLHKVMKRGVMPDGTQASVEMQQAAMYVLLQDKGNNEDAQEIRDAVAKQGMMVDEETGKYYEALRDSDGFLVLNDYGFAQLDKSKEIVNAKEIDRRRDWQQFFLDATKGSSHSMISFSGTNKSEAGAGTLVDDMRHGFVRDAAGGKMSAQTMHKADVDELKFMLEDIHSPTGTFQHVSPEMRQKAADSIRRSILSLIHSPDLNPTVDARNRGAMYDILHELNPEEYPYTEVDGKRIYAVDDDNVIIPLSERDGTESEFAAPVDVAGVHYWATTRDEATGVERRKGYYTDWDIDMRLDE